MSTRFKGFALLAILVSAAGVMPVFAASPYAIQSSMNATSSSSTLGMVPSSNDAITVTTDKPSYNDGDKVTISGSTRDYISDTPVTVMIRNPIGNIIKIDQVELGTDKTYSTSITAGGSLWQAAGTYEVLVQFGSKDRSVQTTFQFSGSSAGGLGNTIKVDGTNMTVTYSITNGKVLGIKADTQSKSLIVAIQTTGNGVLTITLPRALIDSKTKGGVDEQYVVLTDGQEADFQETSTTKTDRTLTIPFEDGTQEIEIIGTQIVPEFGPIAALVLAIAIVSIIAVSAKTGLRLMPRY